MSDPAAGEEVTPRIKTPHAAALSMAYDVLQRRCPGTGALGPLQELLFTIRELASPAGRYVLVERAYFEALELDANRLAMLDALIEEDRVIVDNNQLPPVSVYLDSDQEPQNFYSLAAAGDAALTQDYPGKPVERKQAADV